jgi:hypothetical protein
MKFYPYPDILPIKKKKRIRKRYFDTFFQPREMEL